MKKTSIKIISVICSAVLAVSASAVFPANMPAYAETASASQSVRTVYINNTEDFLKLAEDCRIDSASKNLNVVLTADISLSGTKFFGIPIFCGTFDGGGHTVSGLSIRDNASEIGLFRHVERGAVIKNLNVSGTVAPSGSRDMVGGIVGVNRGTVISCNFRSSVSGNNSVGGIAGKNEESGVISGCSSSATVAAESSGGGIVGTNLGVITDCSNSGSINAVYTDTEINADELNQDNLEDLANMPAGNMIGKTDIGGIAGYSSGVIQHCSNSGTVGYQHTGYNIGGIAGRQNGMISSCENTGSVFGRKDVGGIAGQMEPYRSIEFSEDSVQRLGAEMDILSASVDNLVSDAEGSGINSEVRTLISQLNAAQENADKIADRAKTVLNGYSDEINELLALGDTALDDALPALEQLEAALELLGSFSDECAEALSKLEQGEAADAAREALKDIDSALSVLGEGLRDISTTVDPDEIKNALSEINAASASLMDAAADLASAIGEISDNGGLSVDGNAADIMSQMSDKLSETAKQIEDITNSLSGKSEIRFPAFDSTFSEAVDDLSANMKGMISTLSRINNAASSEGGALLDDVQTINVSIDRIFGLFKDTYKDLLSDDEKEHSEDISEDDSAGDSLHGKAQNCTNSGIVEGDVNVGGITGSMAIEVDFDPEDDIAVSGERSINFSYNVSDVIESCENSGRITAKKNYCGGIVGRMDLGLVKNSLASGTVSATGGSYVGGIAGYSSAKLRGCSSKVSLSGMSYIGGIAGEGGIMTDCLSISDITEYSEKIGALAGYVDFSKKNVEIERNFFVDRGIAGIDRVSYDGIAKPMSYSKFAELTGDFADIVIEFTADGETLAKLKVPYGGSVKASDIPEIPKKSGYYARWEDYDFENITFPHVLEAEYIQLLTSVGSDKTSEQGLPLVLADGSFDDTASVKIETESSGISAPEGSELRMITISSDSAPTALRFLKTGDNPKLMQYVNGAWKAVPFTENGSYLIIKDPSLENGTAVFCVLGSDADPAMIITIAVIAAVVIIAVTVILILIRKNRSKKKQHQKLQIG